ncbi:MAG: response regulator transcription factor [Micromonosporaceae bacterium]|nr:response regulator transcription factor [Micromonosporaceae bacterium]
MTGETGTRPITVLLADDQDLVRAGFRVILGTEEDIEVVGEARNGAEAIERVAATRPDVVLMDVQMPDVDGLEATRRILADTDPDRPQTRVVILTTFDRDDYLFAALQAGASGFLLKNARPEDLIEAVRVVARGDALLSPEVTRRVIAQFSRRAQVNQGSKPAAPHRPPELTDREYDVLVAMARGASNAEIAQQFGVTEATVKTHVSRVLVKLGLRDRTHAVVYAYENGVVAPGS